MGYQNGRVVVARTDALGQCGYHSGGTIIQGSSVPAPKGYIRSMTYLLSSRRRLASKRKIRPQRMSGYVKYLVSPGI